MGLIVGGVGVVREELAEDLEHVRVVVAPPTVVHVRVELQPWTKGPRSRSVPIRHVFILFLPREQNQCSLLGKHGLIAKIFMF